MIQMRNSEADKHAFRRRLVAMVALVFACFGLLLVRLFWLQVLQHRQYEARADSNSIALLPLVPVRGMILDRHGIVLARNVPTYTLEITPSKLHFRVDTVLDQLATVVAVSPHDRRRFNALLANTRSFATVVLRTNLSEVEVARFATNSFRFPGVEVQARLLRQYPYGALATHALGYIGRINQRESDDIDAAGDSANYVGSDNIGKTGLEESYEAQLHGTTGFQQVEVTASGRSVRTLSRTLPLAGKNLMLSLDAGLQQVIEKAFGNHRGALVAIDPRTGDVLAYVSKPDYDPNLFVDGIDEDSWTTLNTSIDRPLLNRPLSGTYAPGSTFKPYMALAALELGLRTPQQSFDDPGYLMVGGHKFRDDANHGVVNLRKSIVVSCNTYYYRLGTEMTIDTIHRFMQQFGFGAPTGIDLSNESVGILPSTDWKRRQFKSPALGKWYIGDTVSISNGSGYNAYTPLQIAEAIATLANNGVAIKPHLVHSIVDPVTGVATMVTAPLRRIALQQKNIDLIKDAMVGVTTDRNGTAAKVFVGVDYAVGGKTGTAQVVGIHKNAKYNSAALAERLRDNGLFIAFAPVDQPRIALAVVVENGGWGDAVAAPIARVAIDYYMHERAEGKAAGNPMLMVSPPILSRRTVLHSNPSPAGITGVQRVAG